MSFISPPSPADRCLLRGRNPSTLLRKGCASRFLSIATAESGFIRAVNRIIGLISFNQITANVQSSLQAADNLPSACAPEFRYFISKEDRLLRQPAGCQRRGGAVILRQAWLVCSGASSTSGSTCCRIESSSIGLVDFPLRVRTIL